MNLSKELKQHEDFIKKVQTGLKPMLEWVDPKAFVAGGCPLSLVTNKPVNDVDVYFTSPFNHQTFLFLEKVYGKHGVALTKPKVRDYDNPAWKLIAEATIDEVKYQFMWVNMPSDIRPNEFVKNVLDGFDINICKLGLMFTSSEVFLQTTPEHIEDLKQKKLTLNVGMSELQTKKTLTVRFPKYLQKFPGSSLDVIDVTDKKREKGLLAKKKKSFDEDEVAPAPGSSMTVSIPGDYSINFSSTEAAATVASPQRSQVEPSTVSDSYPLVGCDCESCNAARSVR
jgi:hypothetical protein